MLTQLQVEQIDEALKRGDTPEEVARLFGINRNSLNYQLLQAGKKIIITRRLADTAPVAADEPKALALTR